MNNTESLFIPAKEASFLRKRGLKKEGKITYGEAFNFLEEHSATKVEVYASKHYTLFPYTKTERYAYNIYYQGTICTNNWYESWQNAAQKALEIALKLTRR